MSGPTRVRLSPGLPYPRIQPKKWTPPGGAYVKGTLPSSGSPTRCSAQSGKSINHGKWEINHYRLYIMECSFSSNQNQIDDRKQIKIKLMTAK